MQLFFKNVNKCNESGGINGHLSQNLLSKQYIRSEVNYKKVTEGVLKSSGFLATLLFSSKRLQLRRAIQVKNDLFLIWNSGAFRDLMFFMRSLFFFYLIVIYSFNVNATMRIVCGARELIVGINCSDRKDFTQYFKAEFGEHGSADSAFASSPSPLTPSIMYGVSAINNTMILSIDKKIDDGRINSTAHGSFEKEGDQFSVSYSESGNNSNSCEIRDYTMICIYTAKDLEFKSK